MLVVAGSKICYRTVSRGFFHCERCGGDRPYRRRRGRRTVHLLGVPVLALGGTGEHLICAVCGTCYRVDLLALPTARQMEVTLLEGTVAAMAAILRAGADGPAARRRAVQAIRAAGGSGYDETALTAVMADRLPDVRLAIQTLALQLEQHASEWFLANVVQVGLAGGALSPAERDVLGAIAGYLGISRQRAGAVISGAEQSAQAG